MSIRSRPPSIPARLSLVLFGGGVGLVLAFGLVYARQLLQHPPRKVTVADHAKVRAKLDENPKAICMFDEEVSYRLKPNFRGLRYFTTDLPHETNSLGLVGRDEVDDDPQVRKILFLGDSVAYGNGVPEESTFVARIQATAGSNFQLLNGACPGWSTHQELKFFERHLQRVPCELLVIVFCVNDLAKYDWVYDSGGEPRLSGEVPQWAEGTSQVVKLSLRRKSFDLDSATAPLAKHNNGFLLAWDDSTWESYEREVLRPFLAKRSTPPVAFVALPSAHQVEAARLGASRDEVFFPQVRLREACQRCGAFYLDAADSLAAVTEPDSAPFADDCHLTIEGHQRVAAFLWPQLQRLIVRAGQSQRR